MPFFVPSQSVLVVDDDPAIHRLIGRFLRLHGFTPLLASSLAEVIEVADTHAVGALILDLGLRGAQSGLDVLRWFRARPRYRNLPVLVLTGQLRLSEDEQAAVDYYGAHVFFKPQKLHLLIDRLKSATRAPAADDSGSTPLPHADSPAGAV